MRSLSRKQVGACGPWAFESPRFRSHRDRQVVMTPGSHPGSRGSTPRRGTQSMPGGPVARTSGCYPEDERSTRSLAATARWPSIKVRGCKPRHAGESPARASNVVVVQRKRIPARHAGDGSSTLPDHTEKERHAEEVSTMSIRSCAGRLGHRPAHAAPGPQLQGHLTRSETGRPRRGVRAARPKWVLSGRGGSRYRSRPLCPPWAGPPLPVRS